MAFIHAIGRRGHGDGACRGPGYGRGCLFGPHGERDRGRNGVSAKYLAKWNGTVWSPIRDGVNGFVASLMRDPSGNMFAGGDFTMVGGLSANGIAELLK